MTEAALQDRTTAPLARVTDDLNGLLANIRAGLDTLDRTGRYGENVIVQLILKEAAEPVEYECFAPHGYTALLDRLLTLHAARNRAIRMKAYRVGGYRGPHRYDATLWANKLLRNQVTHVAVTLRGHRFWTERRVQG